jgi:hypothetical protein
MEDGLGNSVINLKNHEILLQHANFCNKRTSKQYPHQQ